MAYTCPVCGYPELTRDPNYIASFEICTSCWFQFRITDDDEGYSYAQWRQKWIDGGMVWRNGISAPPAGWDPVKQLLNLKK